MAGFFSYLVGREENVAGFFSYLVGKLADEEGGSEKGAVCLKSMAGCRTK